MHVCCWPFCFSRKSVSPPASTLHGETISHISSLPPSVQEEIPWRVAHATLQAFQSPGLSPSRNLPSSVISRAQKAAAQTSFHEDSIQAIGIDREVSQVARRASLRHYQPVKTLETLMEATSFSLGRPASTGEGVPLSAPCPGAVNEVQSVSPTKRQSRSCEISKKERSAASEEKEFVSEGDASAATMVALILKEMLPGERDPEKTQRTRLIYQDDNREIYQISPVHKSGKLAYFDLKTQTFSPNTRFIYSDDNREIYQIPLPNECGEPIYFDLKTRNSTPGMHGVSQGFDDN